MRVTRAQARAHFDYVMDTVLERDNNSPLKKSLLAINIDNIFALLPLNITMINSLTYDKSETEKDVPIPLGDKSLLSLFKEYILFKDDSDDPITDWGAVDPEDFDQFRISPMQIARGNFHPTLNPNAPVVGPICGTLK